MEEKRIYRPLPVFDKEDIERILDSALSEALILLPLSLGEYHPNWKEAQDICVSLADHQDERVRANAALGIAYTARTKGKLEKHIIKPVLIKLLATCPGQQGRVIDAIEDVNFYMHWKIGEKAIARLQDEQGLK